MTPLESHHEESENAENSKALVENIVRLKNMGGVQKMQEWFDRQTPDEKASLLRAENTNALTKAIGKLRDIGGIANVEGIMKSLIFFAATYGVIDVDEEMLRNSRGLPNSFMFAIPDVAARAILTALGAGAVYPVWKLGKMVDESNENSAPQIREQVRASMGKLGNHGTQNEVVQNDEGEEDEQLAA